MNYGLIDTPTLQGSECLVLGLFSDTEFSDFTKIIDEQQNQLISRLFAKLTEPGDLLWQSDINGHSLLLIHCGKKEEFTSQVLTKRMNAITAALLKQGITSANYCLPAVCEQTANWQLQQMILSIENQSYQLSDFKSKKDQQAKLKAVSFHLPGANEKTIKAAEAIAAGVKLTRTLADLPANVCTPNYLGNQAIELAKDFDNLDVKVMGPNEIRAMKMGALIAVSQGSIEEPRFIELQYRGAGNAAPIVLVGKGITFDSGGLSLKPANAMDEMKYDMAGAASVLGTLKACASLQLPINVVGLIASAENMPGGKAIKPGDIITSMSGQTVEILNTDAEGRLVLADALTYAERFNPHLVIDIATLTGAIIVALGGVHTGFMTKDEDLAAQILQAAKDSDDKSWRMPLDEDYQEALDSPLADMINASFDRNAGAITAACFLSRFTKNYRWAHLDIAGTAWVSGKKRQATGRPVPLLIELLRHATNPR